VGGDVTKVRMATKKKKRKKERMRREEGRGCVEDTNSYI